MNIVMMTNTYLPHVGGVARSVETVAGEMRRLGHRVLVVAPEFPGLPESEEDVVRVPALQNFNGSDFSVRLPVPGLLDGPLEAFAPDLIHSHHPFLLGDTAVRVASDRGLPLLFTHHTLYEEYTHYVGNSEALKRFIVELSTGFANLCDQVIAPSDSVLALLRERGVTAPVTVVPTGIDFLRFQDADGGRFREKMGIPPGAFVVGHVGRLAPEKNLPFLTDAVCQFLASEPEAFFLVVGKGPSEEGMREALSAQGLLERARFAGIQKGPDLADAYAAMDLFAFASQSETQGMVLAEAMCAGTPVVAVDASGAREIVSDGNNGRLLPVEDASLFASALAYVASLTPAAREQMRAQAKQTGKRFSLSETGEKLETVYKSAIAKKRTWEPTDDSLWASAMRRIQSEWKLLQNLASAAGSALSSPTEIAK